ncbi:MAG: hypothetical protein AABX47_03745 [Nanoarchaeota archaeon]|mgnify:CR=1 FL=1
MAELVGLKSPENYWWHVALVFTLAVSYALISGSQIIVTTMIGTEMITRYLLLIITGLLFALISGMMLSAQCSSPEQMFFATRNVSFFPACFVAWLVTTITGMQAAAKSFAAENLINYSDPFGEMVNPIFAGAIVLIVADACLIPAMMKTEGEKRSLIKYEALVILAYFLFARIIKSII